MPENLLLLPAPRQLKQQDKTTALTGAKLIVLNGPAPWKLRFIANRIRQALRESAGVTWKIVAGNAVPAAQIGLTLSVVPDGTTHPQGYQLAITPRKIYIVAGSAAGAFYGGLTLLQIIEQCGGNVPLLRINDWPDFPNRGVMLDISRDKVPTMETLFNLVDKLASWKINQLQIYTEHTFAYQNHPEVWANASPLTGEEVLALDAFCRERFIELVPNQNMFGHMRRWLIHERYNPLAECPDGCDTGDPEWDYFEEPFTLAPGHPEVLPLVCSLLDELGPHFTSRQFNIGCDEPVELGMGASREIVAQKGKGRVYLDFLLKIYHEVRARGYTAQFWGDIIMAYPKLVPELPHDAIAMEWGYEAGHPFAKHGAKFAEAGIPFYVCPGTSSWNSIAGRTHNAIANLQNAAENGLKHGAVGYLNTDWGDNGHWQPLPVSYLGLVYGAALGWACQANKAQDVARLTSVFAFGDSTGATGQLAYDLGDVYRGAGGSIHNNSLLFLLLQESPAQIAARADLTVNRLQKTLAQVEQAAARLVKIRPQGDDAGWVRREFAWAAGMLRHACRRGIWALQKQADGDLRRQLAKEAEGLVTEYRELWAARNRPGGFEDSFARLGKMQHDYQ